VTRHRRNDDVEVEMVALVDRRAGERDRLALQDSLGQRSLDLFS
jgi:hypothetical protein